MALMTVHLAINLAVLPLFSINVAYNRIRVPGIVTLFMGVGNFALAIALAHFTGGGYYGVVVAGSIVLTLKNTLFTPWYATRILGVEARTFVRSMLPGIAATILIVVSSATLNTFFHISSFVSLAITGGVIFLVYSAIVWIFGLSRAERTLLGSYMPQKIRRFVT